MPVVLAGLVGAIAVIKITKCDKWLQSCSTLCDPTYCSPPASSVHENFQARILEWVAFPSPGDLPDPGIQPTSLMSPALACGFFTTSATWDAIIITIIKS